MDDQTEKIALKFPAFLIARGDRPAIEGTGRERSEFVMVPVGGPGGPNDHALLLFSTEFLCSRFIAANPKLGPMFPHEIKSRAHMLQWMRDQSFRGPIAGYVAKDPDDRLEGSQEMYASSAVIRFLETKNQDE
jgi:hypothetical protein